MPIFFFVVAHRVFRSTCAEFYPVMLFPIIVAIADTGTCFKIVINLSYVKKTSILGNLSAIFIWGILGDVLDWPDLR